MICSRCIYWGNDDFVFVNSFRQVAIYYIDGLHILQCMCVLFMQTSKEISGRLRPSIYDVHDMLRSEVRCNQLVPGGPAALALVKCAEQAD